MAKPLYGNSKKYQQPRKVGDQEQQVAFGGSSVYTVPLAVLGTVYSKLASEKIKASKKRHKEKFDKTKEGYNKPPSSVRLNK